MTRVGSSPSHEVVHIDWELITWCTAVSKVSYLTEAILRPNSVGSIHFSVSWQVNHAFASLADVNDRTREELEVLVIHHIIVTIGNQDTTTFSDWIARVEWRHQCAFEVDLHFPGRCGARHYHPDVEPFCSLGGTVGARGGLCSVKFWLTFVKVTRLKTCAGWMRPGK